MENSAFDHRLWYHENCHRLVGGGLWLRGDEPGRLPAEAWDAHPFRVLFTRLSGWHDTLGSMTHTVFYRLLEGIDGCFPDLAWLPAFHDGEVLTGAGIPWLLGSGSHRDFRAFDVVGISNALVQELLNVPTLLERSGIPLTLPERQAREDLPLLVLGGANALQSSVLWGAQAAVDVVFLAEEPEVIQTFFTRIRDGRRAGEPKESIRQGLKEIPGAFLPDDPRPRARKVHASVPHLNGALVGAPVFPAQGVAGTGTVQISEGCPWFCSFCAESWSRKPYREVPGDEVLRFARELKREQGLSKIDLYSFNFNTHASIRPLVAALLEEFSLVGLKSQRFDALARDPALVELLRLAGKTSVTCALEGISPRMRAFLQKDLSDHDIERAFDALLHARLRELKIFVIATGHEEEEDYAAFRATLAMVREKLLRAPTSPRVMVSATPLVRFPWTPLEFDNMPDVKTLSRAVGFIKSECVKMGFEFRGAASAAESWVSQVLARPRSPLVWEAAQAACRKAGYVFREGIEEEFRAVFEAELAARGLTPEFVTSAFAPEDEVPWMDLEPGVSRAALVRLWDACRKFEPKPTCLALGREDGSCRGCGACTPEERATVTGHRDAPMPDLTRLAARLQALRRAEMQISLTVDLSERCQGLPMDFVHSRLARAFMCAFPELVPLFRHFEAPGRSEEGKDCLASGIEVLRPVFLPAGLERVRQILSEPAALTAVNAAFAPWGKVLCEGEPDIMATVWEFRTAFRPDPAAYLAAHGLRHMLRRDGDLRIFDLPKDSLKKKFLRGLTLRETVDGFLMSVEAGPKFSVRDFLCDACAGQDLSDHFRRFARRVR